MLHVHIRKPRSGALKLLACSTVTAIALLSPPATSVPIAGWHELEYQQPVVLPGSNQTHLELPGLPDLPGPLSTPTAAGGCANAIACENALPGTPPSQWAILEPGDTSILGFATNQSVNVGATITFKINNVSEGPYYIDIFRVGWYQGNGARKIVSRLRPTGSLLRQDPCTVHTPPNPADRTGLIDCGNWAPSASWAVPTTAVSGVYFARLVRESNGGSSYIFFTVRNDANHSAIVYQTADTTRAAYNTYGGNSLYTCTVSCPPGNPHLYKGAAKVSFNRPNIAISQGMQYSFFGAEFELVEFLEANGYDVNYISGVDTDRLGDLLKNHQLFISSGHDEYWSGNQRAKVEAARDAGVNLAFFAGNDVFWKTRYENSIDGNNTSYRTLVTYKETHYDGQVDPQKVNGIWTGTWRDGRYSPPADGGRPENSLTGSIYTVDPPADFSIKVPAADGKMRFWRNTPVATQAAGQTATLAPNTLGYEWNEDLDNGGRPPGIVRLSTNTENVQYKLIDEGNTYNSGGATHHLVLHRAASGALVFSAGTVQWSWGLEGSPDGTEGVDVNMQQATVNLFADMGVLPTTLIADLTQPVGTTDSTPPTAVITSPAANSDVVQNSTVNIMGTASDTGGVVGGVEVSVNGGATWHPASGRANWMYQWKPLATGTFSLRARAVDDSANLGPSSTPVSVTVLARACPCTIWPSNAAPVVTADLDNVPIEVGVKFYADNNGFITGIRFFKSTFNTGPHVAHLWTANGNLLATANFTGESASGWQQVNFQNPVAIAAGTHYVASYHTTKGRYAGDTGYFTEQGFDNAPLHALKDGVDGGNGVYVYGNGTIFPTTTYKSTNYWVDVVFSANGGGGGDTTPPTVTTRIPASGATNVAVSSTVRATFSEVVQQSTIVFALKRTSNGAAVPASVSYNASNRTATLKPTVLLAAGVQYTATVSGAKDASNNTMASTSWSFTTAAASTAACPCTIWPSSATPVVAADPDNIGTEVGVKFRSDVGGAITGIRFYKSSANIGPHQGHLWNASGTLLASATFTNETASGWQQVNFSQPVVISANTVYIASYHTKSGRYAADVGYFANNGTDRGPLHALRDGFSGANGVYAYSPNTIFPNQTYNSSNYWVDVVFTTSPVTCPCTIWPSSAAPVKAADPDNIGTEVGLKFRADVSGTITGIRFYKAATNTGTHVARLWRSNDATGSSGTLLASATFTNETASGWQQVNFPTPVAITAGTTYIASYHTKTGHYAADPGYFSNNGVDRGPLQALQNGVAGPNSVYAYSPNPIFPNQTYNSSNYWVDVVFQP